MFVSCESRHGVQWFESTVLRHCGVTHGFSTRRGGVSTGCHASLNLDAPRDQAGDDPAHLQVNHQRWLEALKLAERQPQFLRQVHGAVVIEAGAANCHERPSADAACSALPDHPVAVRVADCVPVLVSSHDGQVVAAVHAGWRGLVAGVIPQTLALLAERWQRTPSQLTAAVGPCIQAQQYEVDQDVAAQFLSADLAAAVERQHGPKPHVNLSAAAALQLTRAGMPAEQVDIAELCTFSQEDLFFSHRRDAARLGGAGRLLAMIAPR